MGVLETRLDGRTWIMGDDYTIADLAIFPWVNTVKGFYQAGGITGLDTSANVLAWLDRCMARPASQAAQNIPQRP